MTASALLRVRNANVNAHRTNGLAVPLAGLAASADRGDREGIFTKAEMDCCTVGLTVGTGIGGCIPQP